LLYQWLPGNHNHIKSWLKVGVKLANGFPEQTPHPVSADGLPQVLGSDKTIAVVGQPVRCQTDGHEPMMVNTTFAAQTREIFTPAQPETPLHQR
jgi:hypothetical protein